MFYSRDVTRRRAPVTLRATASPPIDPSALQAVLAPLPESRALPADAYVSDEVFLWEMEHFFERSWVCVGRARDLAESGHRAAYRVGSEGILLVRDEAGDLHGFFNVCRHRGHELLEAGSSATGRVIKCPYHAWVYGLDGKLRGAPRFGHLPESDPVHEGLVPARVADWRGWAFVNASGDATDFAGHVGNLDQFVRGHEPERLVAGAGHEYIVQANWKIIVENYHECYHCSSIHPELCRVTPIDSGVNLEPTGLWVGGSMDLKAHAETMSFSGQGSGAPLRGLDDEQRRKVYYLGLFPNMLISPHPDYVMTHVIEPLAPDRSRIECQWLFAPEVAERPGFDPSYAVEFWDTTNQQDWQACESVQRGVSSRGYRPGPLALQEDEVHQFQTMVARGYLEGAPALPSTD